MVAKMNDRIEKITFKAELMNYAGSDSSESLTKDKMLIEFLAEYQSGDEKEHLKMSKIISYEYFENNYFEMVGQMGWALIEELKQKRKED